MVLQEEINWRELTGSHSGYREATPSLEIKPFYMLGNEDSKYFLEQVERLRKESAVQKSGDAIKWRMSGLSTEKEKLERLLEDYDPAAQAESFLDRQRQ